MNQEEVINCVVIRNVLKNKQSELVKMQKDIFKICEDPLLIDEYLADADVRNIFVDEAQDLSIVTFVALSKIFWQSYFSVFGDLAQGMYSYQSICDWQELNLLIVQNKNFVKSQ